MSAIWEPRGLTWWGRARDELRAADRASGRAQESLTPEGAHFALFQIAEARARLDDAETAIRRTIRALENTATAEL